MRPQIELTDTIDDAARQAILDGLNEFNRERAGAHEYRRLGLLLRGPDGGRVVGGLVGWSYWEWLFIELFYLPETLRGRGLGTELMRRAEAEARARGCRGVCLDTFGFQARGFYEKLGYRVFGTLEDMPPGDARHYLARRLTP